MACLIRRLHTGRSMLLHLESPGCGRVDRVWVLPHLLCISALVSIRSLGERQAETTFVRPRFLLELASSFKSMCVLHMHTALREHPLLVPSTSLGLRACRPHSAPHACQLNLGC